MARRGKLVDEYREFTREVLLRLERIAAEIREEARIHREESRAYHERENKRLDEILDHSRELREECRDQSKALMHVLAKLDNGGAAPAG